MSPWGIALVRILRDDRRPDPASRGTLAGRIPRCRGLRKEVPAGAGVRRKIQIRFSGQDPNTIRGLAEQTTGILYGDGHAKAIRTDWRQRVKVMRPVLAEEEANNAGANTQDVALAVKSSFEGSSVGVYREGDELLPIVFRAPEGERGDIASANKLQIWSPAAQRAIPLRQVVRRFETTFEDEIVQRLNRKTTITVHAWLPPC